MLSDAASRYNLPAELLAGVCWIEVAGDPSFIDRVAFEVRAFDWSGPDWVDPNHRGAIQPRHGLVARTDREEHELRRLHRQDLDPATRAAEMTAKGRSSFKGWRAAAYLLFALGATLALALSGNKYDWMQDAEAGMPAVEDASGNRTVFVLVLLAAVSIPQLMMFVSTHSRRERLLSAALLAAAFIIGWSRY